MNQITNITVDISTPRFILVHEKQNDSNRWIYAAVTDNGTDFNIPSGAIGIVRVAKPDGTACVYDSDDFGSAIIVSGSTVQIKLVDQVLTVAGTAVMSVGLYTSGSERITSFNFKIEIEKDAVTDQTIESTDFYNVFSSRIAYILEQESKFRNATAVAEPLPSSADPTIDFTEADGAYHFEFGIPRGISLSTAFFAFNNKVSTEFNYNSTHPAFPYRATIPTNSATTSNMTALVFFSDAQMDTLHYAPYADCYNGGVYIYSTVPGDAITVPRILVIDGTV